VAWGSVTVTNAGGGTSTLTGGIGCTVVHVLGVGTAGMTDVTLNVNDPNGGGHTFAVGGSALVASVDPGVAGGPALITVTQIAANRYRVTTFNLAGANLDMNFFFHGVTN
jgi:hypothetical protein